ncbi:MAG: hypothetical protein L0212_11410, partial [Acidobacteria bacterium]|nr:hypothetical protein [Acidobacteriota bacterium]
PKTPTAARARARPAKRVSSPPAKCVTATELRPVRGGLKGAAGAQFRAQLEARVEFEFREWGKLQMALAGGSQHMNVLKADPGAAAAPSGGTPLAGVAVQAGSTASEVFVGGGAVDSFAVGDVIAVDIDYTAQTGYVGSGVSGAYVRAASDVGSDVNYIRRITFNVGRVSAKTATSLQLAQPLIGGVPSTSAKVQKVVALLDRESGSFFQEWSALFVLPEGSGGRVCFYYPRLQPAAPAQEAAIELALPLESLALRAAFLALPHTDANDNEQVLCYRSFYPPASAALY